MTAAAATLLPGNAGPFERALATALTDELPVPIREIMDPATTPLPFLPFLAAHRSVDLWFEDWPEARKREMIARAPELAAIVGASASAAAFLPFVDAEIVHKRTHPERFVIGRSALGLVPIGHKAFTTHFLIRVPLKLPAHGFILGRSAVGRAALRTPNREPLRRVRMALTASKAPETAYSVNYGHRRPVTFDDGFPLDGSFRFGDYRNRTRI